MAKLQIGDKGLIRCEVRGFSQHTTERNPIRMITVEAFGHLISMFETEFIHDCQSQKGNPDVKPECH